MHLFARSSRIVWTAGEIDEIDERRIQANEGTNDDYYLLRYLPKAMVDKLTRSVHMATAFLLCLSVFSTQVDVRMNKCMCLLRKKRTDESSIA